VSSIADDNAITREGYERLQAELDELIAVRRPEVALRLRAARADGGEPGENVELGDALEEQVLLERRIAELRHRLAAAHVVECIANGTVSIGSHVHVRTPGGAVAVYQVVGAHEGDPARRRLSRQSPVGQALLGRAEGDVVHVDAPGGRLRFEVLRVDASPEALAA
jgi:transcription elongation factor GreA